MYGKCIALTLATALLAIALPYNALATSVNAATDRGTEKTIPVVQIIPFQNEDGSYSFNISDVYTALGLEAPGNTESPPFEEQALRDAGVQYTIAASLVGRYETPVVTTTRVVVEKVDESLIEAILAGESFDNECGCLEEVVSIDTSKDILSLFPDGIELFYENGELFAKTEFTETSKFYGEVYRYNAVIQNPDGSVRLQSLSDGLHTLTHSRTAANGDIWGKVDVQAEFGVVLGGCVGIGSEYWDFTENRATSCSEQKGSGYLHAMSSWYIAGESTWNGYGFTKLYAKAVIYVSLDAVVTYDGHAYWLPFPSC